MDEIEELVFILPSIKRDLLSKCIEELYKGPWKVQVYFQGPESIEELCKDTDYRNIARGNECL